MKKISYYFVFFIKAALLILILIFGWVFVNAQNLAKGKKTKQSSDPNELWGINNASADVKGGGGSCPHVAYFDGKKFLIENDFLLGKPQSFLTDFEAIKHLYEAGRIGPDLLKFHTEPQSYDGKLTLQLQEIEVEETFVKWLKLFRVVHPRTSEVVVNANFTDFHIYDREYLKKNIMLPLSIEHNRSKDISHLFGDRGRLWSGLDSDKGLFEKNDELSVVFRNLDPNKPAGLIMKSWYRDWMMGEAENIKKSRVLSFIRSPQVARILILVVAALHTIFGREATGTALAFLPFFIGTQAHSIVLSYRDGRNKKHYIVVHEPRDWRYGTERIDLPSGAVGKDGSLALTLDFTNRHKLGFLGIIQDNPEVPVRVEELSVEEVRHSRLGSLNGSGKETSSSYIHLIPGDTTDVVFKNPAAAPKPEEQISYLMQSSGFYTALRKENKILAGNWREKISEEARERLASLERHQS